MPAFPVPANYAFDSYSSLATAINDWLDRTDLSGVAGQMIALCEARLRREIVPLFSEASYSVTTTADGIGALPTDYGTLNRVTYSGRVLPQYAVNTAELVPTATTPWGYTLEADGIRLWPAGAQTVSLLYQPTLPQLSEATPSNTLLDRHPDLYFYGSLLFAEGYLANDNRAATFKALWDEAIREAKVYLTRQRFAGPLVPRFAFVP